MRFMFVIVSLSMRVQFVAKSQYDYYISGTAKVLNSIILFFFLFPTILLTSCVATSSPNDKESVLLRIRMGEKYGFINEDGKIVIEPQFDDVGHVVFSEDLCCVVIGEKKGIIDKEGNLIIELADSVSYVSPFKNGYAEVDFNTGLSNVIDKSGNYIFPEPKNDIEINVDGDNIYFIESNITDTLIENNPRNAYIYDVNGDIIGEPFEEIGGFSEGVCNIKLNNRWGYVDKDGHIVIDTIYNVAKVFSSDGLARVQRNNEEFFINKNGDKIITVDKTLTGFNCNRAAVEIDGKKYLINNKGDRVCEINADEIYSFADTDSLATILKNGKASKIDTLGNIVLSTKYENIGEFTNGVALIVKNDKTGVINIKGEEIISPSFTHRGRLTYDEYGLSPNFHFISLANKVDNRFEFSFYDLQGKLIGKDMPMRKAVIPNNPIKEDFIKCFDSRLSDLDPIEGLYYVTIEDYYQHRTNSDIMGKNNSKSKFYAIIKDANNNEYNVYAADGSNNWWVNKFVRIGDSNNYAIVPNELVVPAGEKKYSSEGKMTLEDPYKFDFRLEKSHNNSYNFFVTYEFVKDYPPVSEYEKLQQVEWTGSGFAIADGYIATNYHVTSGAKTIYVRGINGDMDEVYKGAVVANDKEHDLSIIKIVDKDFDSLGFIPYSIGKTSVDVGDDIFVLGYPIVDTMGKEVKLTEGVISSSTGYKGNGAMYQISAAVQPGNSGGPLFNEGGVVIGVVCAKHADAENASYATKISNLYSLINSSNLGINLADNNVNEKKLSKIVKKVKGYVYLIECSSK